MLRNYLTTAFRNAMRRPVNTGVNILGLAIGVACCLVIALYVRDELSWDQFHEHADRLYRVEQTISEGTHRWSVASVDHASALEDMVPEIEETARVFTRGYVVRSGETALDGESIGFADAALFDMFSFEHVAGGDGLLDEPEDIVLTRSLAERLFGDENPVGRPVLLDNAIEMTVSGVVDLPPNSQLGGEDAFVQFEIVYDHYSWLENNLGASTTVTYALLGPGADPAAARARLPEVSERVRGNAGAETLHLKPVTELRLTPETTGSTGTQGTVNLFIAIALLVLLIACVNYVNLATAGGAERLREVGMRKTFGAHRRQLIAQFMGESTVQAVLGLVLALILVEVALPHVNELTDKALRLDVGGNLPGAAAVLLLAVVVGLAAGAYPALYLSRFRPVAILKGRGSERRGSPLLRRSLVVVQFVASITLISGTLAIGDQLEFMQTTDLGIEQHQIVTIDRQSADEASIQEFIRRIRQLPEVEEVSRASVELGNHNWRASMRALDAPEDTETVSHQFIPTGPGFLQMMGTELVAGRHFDAKRTGDDRRALIINETSARALGYADPADALGEQYSVNYVSDGEIVGVVKDFHLNSLREAIGPAVFVHQDNGTYLVAATIATADVAGTIQTVQQIWSEVMPEWPFNYAFADDTFDALYRAEQRTAELFSWFAALAMIVACLGLFGLASLVTRQRTREVGIRKVLGASIRSIFGLLTGGFVALVGVAFLIATPVTWLLMNRWLSGFAYHIDFPVSSLVVAGAVTLLLTVFVVGVRAIRTAIADPVTALRYE